MVSHSQLATFACRPEASKGRLFPESGSGMRTDYQRDRDRIVHSSAFRRLEGKTQVFTPVEGEQFRTRLTHSLEVAQIARTLARALCVDEDLAEAVALAHDLGHSPFGHAGERGLQLALAAHGGFDHNLQTFRIITELEQRYLAFDGLNLTVETLEGLVKHNGPMPNGLPAPVRDHPLLAGLDPMAHAPLEAQIAAISDDVAYCSHDLDDGLRAGLLALDDLAGLPIVGGLVVEVRGLAGDAEPQRLPHELIRRLIDRMVSDLVMQTGKHLAELAPVDPEAIRQAGRQIVIFSPPMAHAVQMLRAFLYERLYRHYKVNRMAFTSQRMVSELVGIFLEAPECLPDPWRRRAGGPHEVATAAAVRDHVASMTDRAAIDEHDRLLHPARWRS